MSSHSGALAQTSAQRVLWYSFLLAAVVNLVSNLLGQSSDVVSPSDNWPAFISKVLLMPLLAVLFLLRMQGTKSDIPQWLILLALFFSWLGDIFLGLGSSQGSWLLWGMGAFGVAHLFYIRAFLSGVDLKSIGRQTLIYGLPFIVYAYLMYSILYHDMTGEDSAFRLPVAIYMIVLISNGLSSFLRRCQQGQPSTASIFVGVVLFVQSDSLIAVDQFVDQVLPLEAFAVMATYILGQSLIIRGCVLRTQEPTPQNAPKSSRVSASGEQFPQSGLTGSMSKGTQGDILFQELKFRNLTVKNRVFRSNISGKFDNYDGSGTQTRINWETRFAKGGVGAIISSYVPVHRSGRILPNYATIESDDRIPFWRKLVEEVHKYDCRFIMQLSHSGRQRDQAGVENQFTLAMSSTSKKDPFHGILCRAMTVPEIQEVIRWFGEAAGRAREAGVDGVELHGANGYLLTQFLSSGINDREDEYGGSLENRARFAIEVVKGIRRVVGNDYHVQFKISTVDHNDQPFFYEKKGNTLQETIQICKWLEQAGLDAFHLSVGSMFPHPLNPVAPSFPYSTAARTYETMLSSGVLTMRNYALFRYRIFHGLFGLLWNRSVKRKARENAALHAELGVTGISPLEGLNAAEAREVRKHVTVPVICTGGFQSASLIRKVLSEGFCDAVSMARPLIANPGLVNDYFAQGKDLPDRPCSHCNKCLVNAIENPLGCYDVNRFSGDYDAMSREIMSVFHPTSFGA